MKFDTGIDRALAVSSHDGWKPRRVSVGIRAGRIEWVTEKPIAPSECGEWIDGSGKILMPGLVNVHCHGDMTLARGFGDGLTLREQGEAYADTNWFYTLISDEDRYCARQLTYCEALLSGTTFLMENMYWGLQERSIEAMREIGIRGALVEDIRYDFADAEALLPEEELLRFRSRTETAGLVPVIGSIAEEDYEPGLLAAIRARRERAGLRQTLHLAETTWRVDRIRGEFGVTPVRYLYENGVLDAGTIGSHVVHCTPEDIGILAETGTKVANTPLCEMKIADGVAPIPQMVRAGVTVCLGTDGAMWNNSNDIFREMKGMSLLHSVHAGVRSLTKQQILDMATVNGARAFGLEAEFGTIEEGKRADLILIGTEHPHLCPLVTGLCENVTSHLIYDVTGRDVTDTFVDGRRLVADGRLQLEKLPQIMERVQAAADKIRRHEERKRTENKK